MKRNPGPWGVSRAKPQTYKKSLSNTVLINRVTTAYVKAYVTTD
jgi:hypothetical protein